MKGVLRRLMQWFRRPRSGRRFGRPDVARIYLRGQGIEIGALHRPLRVPASAHVSYVDRFPREELYRQYPNLADHNLVPVDIVDDAERLARVADESQDFVIANHFLEHCQDPIGTLLHFFRVLREDGILFLTVPDKRYTFDCGRPVTPLEHLLADHECGAEHSRRAHVCEFVRLVLKAVEPDDVQRKTDRLLATDFSIHYHVWTQTELMELLLELRRRLPFEVELFLRRAYEILIILRKGNGSAENLPMPKTALEHVAT
ncbi:MAG TPA: methyltransferase domain-containing protein [Gemmataceae bacterium]|nr:methyltransferase domain-containing protein [Gemmataceae bacterium]